jgi:hypothetical protein
LRKKNEQDTNLSVSDLIKVVFDDLYVTSSYKHAMYKPLTYFSENNVLSMLFYEKTLSEDKSERKCDEVIYEYLQTMKEKTNHQYFLFMIKFAVLFRECFNFSKWNQDGKGDRKEFSQTQKADTCPDLCNEFVTEFLENNNYFGINSEQDKNEFIDLVQHFCYWLFTKQYTLSRLSLIN